MSDKTWECKYERVKPEEVSVCPTCKHYNKCNDKCSKGHHPIRTPDGWIVEDCDDYEAQECPDCIYYVRNKPKCATGWGVLTPYHTWRAERCGDYTPKTAPSPEAYDAKSRYYDAGGIETLEIIKAKLAPVQFEGYLLGNVLKYACRMYHKGDLYRDAEKLALYSKWLEEVSDD